MVAWRLDRPVTRTARFACHSLSCDWHCLYFTTLRKSNFSRPRRPAAWRAAVLSPHVVANMFPPRAAEILNVEIMPVGEHLDVRRATHEAPYPRHETRYFIEMFKP